MEVISELKSKIKDEPWLEQWEERMKNKTDRQNELDEQFYHACN